ncbi:hypothetical protein F5148DRAFT_13489 [Russula earlei]|uniref:Uncharacterized protein n=1 Tax=Russula earlei TaxID=71964 RepID=A0ACC0UL94_9AGAM|nr:hypothetical protein F5148DRAFT_13489 [Russula earlei]
MSALHHDQFASFPSDVSGYWRYCGDAFDYSQSILESRRETPSQVTFEPREAKSPYSFPIAAPRVDLPSSDVTLCSATSSNLDGGDAPVPLRTSGQKRDPNHVPRPLNCFFLFKTDWLAKRRSLLTGIEQDHRQLNRMASSEWRKLPPEAKQRFKDAAYQAKVEHSMKYPGYRFTPKPRGDRRKRKTKRNEPEVLLRNEEAARLVSQGVTGGALHEALAKYDTRCAEEKHYSTVCASSPPSSEGVPSIPSVSSSDVLPSPSFDVNRSRSWVSPPMTSFLDLDTLWDTFVGSAQTVPWTEDVALSQLEHSPAIGESPVVPADPAQDSRLFQFDHLLDDYANLFSSSCSSSVQLFQTDQRVQYPTNGWSGSLGQQLKPPVCESKGTATYSTFRPFKPCSGLAQSTSHASDDSDYQNVPLFDANSFFHKNTPMARFFPF